MLSVLLKYNKDKELADALFAEGFILQNGKWVFMDGLHILLSIESATDEEATIGFPGDLPMNRFKKVHDKLINLADHLEAEIDDSQSLLGYLANGDGAYIVTNWTEWIIFLQEAKLRTLEGKKVRVLDEKETELGNGLYVSSETESTTGNITSCTIITMFGEKTYTSNTLIIEPTNEW
ncbi:hypothetical protein EJF36_16570 [Bacillus sp. HMF5848]|uniref:hypothetical protein n=1 Tax=Bacillus sp. HMF5848 TaxID=2495421 RepID=UPI000F789F1E|nr:hypothetical protein [Bacillus sp. HMF5848]RSK28347.1 hypothetical protein EJF36_16570 [Bacillus sp. HMF5848]